MMKFSVTLLSSVSALQVGNLELEDPVFPPGFATETSLGNQPAPDYSPDMPTSPNEQISCGAEDDCKARAKELHGKDEEDCEKLEDCKELIKDFTKDLMCKPQWQEWFQVQNRAHCQKLDKDKCLNAAGDCAFDTNLKKCDAKTDAQPKFLDLLKETKAQCACKDFTLISCIDKCEWKDDHCEAKQAAGSR